jgi:hypothetical protein
MLAGDELYSNLWANKPPGVFWAYMLAELLWGYEPSAVVYIGIAFTLVSLLFLYMFLREVAGVYTALAGSFFWALASNSVLLQANLPNTELFINCFTFVALWSFVKYRQGKSGFLFLSGLSLVLASVFKMVVVFPYLAVCLYLILPLPKVDTAAWLKENLKKLSVFLLPGFLVWGALFSYFAVTGRFEDFWEMVFVYNRHDRGSILLNVRDFFTQLPHFIRYILDVGGLVIMSLLWLPFSRKEYGPLGRGFFILLVFGTITAVGSPGRYFGHYFQLFLPVITILSALFLWDLTARGGEEGSDKTPGVVKLTFLIALSSMLFFQAAYMGMAPERISRLKYGNEFVQGYEVAGLVESLTKPCDTIYEWGNQTGIYYYSRRKAASGIFYIYPLIDGHEEIRVRTSKRLYEDITGSPPALFIWQDGFGNVEASIFSDFIGENYSVVERLEPYTFYEYRHKKKGGVNGDPGVKDGC